MAYKLVVKEEAKIEISEAYAFYEERQEGLGEKFLEEVQKRFIDLRMNPEYYSFIDNKKNLRDITLSIFPYVIIYRIVAKEVRVYGVLNTHRKPKESY